jgi:WD40 repeat protein
VTRSISRRAARTSSLAALLATTLALAGDDAAKQAKFETLPPPEGAAARCGGPVRRHRGAVLSVAAHADLIVTAGADGLIHFWDRATLAHRSVLTLRGGAFEEARLSPDGARIVVVYAERFLRDYYLSACWLKPFERPWGQPLATDFSETKPRSFAFEPDGRGVFWNATRRVGQLSLPASGAEATSFKVLEEDADLVAVGGGKIALANGSSVSVKAPNAYAEPLKFWPHSRVTALALSRDARTIATGDASGEFAVWKLADPGAKPKPAELASLVFKGGEAAERGVKSLELSKDASLLTVADDRRVQIVDAKTGALRLAVIAEKDLVCCALSTDAKQLVTGFADGVTVRDVDLAAGTASAPKTLGEDPIPLLTATAATARGQAAIAAADAKGVLRVWSPDGKETETIEPTADGWNALALSKDGASLLRGTGKSLRLERRPAGDAAWTIEIQAGLPAAFSADGTRIAVTEAGTHLALLDAATGAVVARSNGAAGWFGSPDRFPAKGPASPFEYVAADGRVTEVIPQRAEVCAAAVSRDGRTAAVWDSQFGYLLYAGGQPASLLEKNAAPMTNGTEQTVAFSDDGGRVAYGTDRGDVAVFDVKTKKRVALFRPDTRAAVTALLFLPGGLRVAAAQDDGAVIVWDAKLLPPPK